VLELFIAQQADLRILTLPEDLDPCDYLHKYGAESFAELLETRAVDALDHAFEVTTRGIDVERDIHGTSQAIERLLGIVAKAPRLSSETRGDTRILEQKIVQRLATKFRVDELELRRRLTALRRRQASIKPRQAITPEVAEIPGSVRETHQSPVEQDAPMQTPPDPWELAVLQLIVAHPESMAVVRDRIGPEWVKNEACRRIFETCCRLADEGVAPTFDRLMLEFDEPAIKNLLVGIDEAALATGQPSANADNLLNELTETLQRKEIERQRPAQIGALRQGGLDDQQQAAMLEDIIRQKRQGSSALTDE
jgi:DNA primase